MEGMFPGMRHFFGELIIDAFQPFAGHLDDVRALWFAPAQKYGKDRADDEGHEDDRQRVCPHIFLAAVKSRFGSFLGIATEFLSFGSRRRFR